MPVERTATRIRIEDHRSIPATGDRRSVSPDGVFSFVRFPPIAMEIAIKAWDW
ncbi:MAG: hypothetical protein IT350_06955 [Deltaproteobacteria bacterium]|nr:hypothetical protein [Deltaproteobacteria bacterium]